MVPWNISHWFGLFHSIHIENDGSYLNPMIRVAKCFAFCCVSLFEAVQFYNVFFDHRNFFDCHAGSWQCVLSIISRPFFVISDFTTGSLILAFLLLAVSLYSVFVSFQLVGESVISLGLSYFLSHWLRVVGYLLLQMYFLDMLHMLSRPYMCSSECPYSTGSEYHVILLVLSSLLLVFFIIVALPYNLFHSSPLSLVSPIPGAKLTGRVGFCIAAVKIILVLFNMIDHWIIPDVGFEDLKTSSLLLSDADIQYYSFTRGCLRFVGSILLLSVLIFHCHTLPHASTFDNRLRAASLGFSVAAGFMATIESIYGKKLHILIILAIPFLCSCPVFFLSNYRHRVLSRKLQQHMVYFSEEFNNDFARAYTQLIDSWARGTSKISLEYTGNGDPLIYYREAGLLRANGTYNGNSGDLNVSKTTKIHQLNNAGSSTADDKSTLKPNFPFPAIGLRSNMSNESFLLSGRNDTILHTQTSNDASNIISSDEIQNTNAISSSSKLDNNNNMVIPNSSNYIKDDDQTTSIGSKKRRQSLDRLSESFSASLKSTTHMSTSAVKLHSSGQGNGISQFLLNRQRFENSISARYKTNISDINVPVDENLKAAAMLQLNKFANSELLKSLRNMIVFDTDVELITREFFFGWRSTSAVQRFFRRGQFTMIVAALLASFSEKRRGILFISLACAMKRIFGETHISPYIIQSSRIYSEFALADIKYYLHILEIELKRNRSKSKKGDFAMSFVGGSRAVSALKSLKLETSKACTLLRNSFNEILEQKIHIESNEESQIQELEKCSKEKPQKQGDVKVHLSLSDVSSLASSSYSDSFSVTSSESIDLFIPPNQIRKLSKDSFDWSKCAPTLSDALDLVIKLENSILDLLKKHSDSSAISDNVQSLKRVFFPEELETNFTKEIPVAGFPDTFKASDSIESSKNSTDFPIQPTESIPLLTQLEAEETDAMPLSIPRNILLAQPPLANNNGQDDDFGLGDVNSSKNGSEIGMDAELLNNAALTSDTIGVDVNENPKIAAVSKLKRGSEQRFRLVRLMMFSLCILTIVATIAIRYTSDYKLNGLANKLHYLIESDLLFSSVPLVTSRVTNFEIAIKNANVGGVAALRELEASSTIRTDLESIASDTDMQAVCQQIFDAVTDATVCGGFFISATSASVVFTKANPTYAIPFSIAYGDPYSNPTFSPILVEAASSPSSVRDSYGTNFFQTVNRTAGVTTSKVAFTAVTPLSGGVATFSGGVIVVLQMNERDTIVDMIYIELVNLFTMLDTAVSDLIMMTADSDMTSIAYFTEENIFPIVRYVQIVTGADKGAFKPLRSKVTFNDFIPQVGMTLISFLETTAESFDAIILPGLSCYYQMIHTYVGGLSDAVDNLRPLISNHVQDLINSSHSSVISAYIPLVAVYVFAGVLAVFIYSSITPHLDRLDGINIPIRLSRLNSVEDLRKVTKYFAKVAEANDPFKVARQFYENIFEEEKEKSKDSQYVENEDNLPNKTEDSDLPSKKLSTPLRVRRNSVHGGTPVEENVKSERHSVLSDSIENEHSTDDHLKDIDVVSFISQSEMGKRRRIRDLGMSKFSKNVRLLYKRLKRRRERYTVAEGVSSTAPWYIRICKGRLSFWSFTLYLLVAVIVALCSFLTLNKLNNFFIFADNLKDVSLGSQSMYKVIPLLPHFQSSDLHSFIYDDDFTQEMLINNMKNLNSIVKEKLLRNGMLPNDVEIPSKTILPGRRTVSREKLLFYPQNLIDTSNDDFYTPVQVYGTSTYSYGTSYQTKHGLWTAVKEWTDNVQRMINKHVDPTTEVYQNSIAVEDLDLMDRYQFSADSQLYYDIIYGLDRLSYSFLDEANTFSNDCSSTLNLIMIISIVCSTVIWLILDYRILLIQREQRRAETLLRILPSLFIAKNKLFDVFFPFDISASFSSVVEATTTTTSENAN